MSCEIVDTIGTGDCEIQEKLNKNDQHFAAVIASELVSEIIDNAVDIAEDRDQKSVAIVGDILDNLSNKFQELDAIEDKQKIVEVNEATPAGPFQGIGDQLEPDEEITKEILPQHRPVEKKNRLTDLVKNSKQLLAKLMLNESKGELHDTKSEKIVRVTDLDLGDQPYKVKKSFPPEDIRLPNKYQRRQFLMLGNDSNEILQEPSEDESLDEIQLSASHDQGTQQTEDQKKTMTFPLAGTSKKTLMDRYRTLKLTGELKKKKWNVGTKIMDYIRKQKAKRNVASVSDGIEIKPQVEKI